MATAGPGVCRGRVFQLRGLAEDVLERCSVGANNDVDVALGGILHFEALEVVEAEVAVSADGYIFNTC